MEKAKKIIYGQNGNISKEGESIKRNQKEILKLKLPQLGEKKNLEGFKSRFEKTEESVNFKIGKLKKKKKI